MVAHQSFAMCQRFDLHSWLHVSSAAAAACAAGLRLAVRAAQGEALFDIRAGLHMLFFSHFFSLVFPTAGIWLNGLLTAALAIPVRMACCAVEHNRAIVQGIKLLYCLFSPNPATASWH